MITGDQVIHLAKLAKMKLTPEEVEKLTPQIEEILQFASQLDEVKITDIEATNQTNGKNNACREDIIFPCEIEEDLLECSPLKKKKNSIVVPKIL